MTRIKICGITTLKDALCAVEAGAHALGFVFYKGSPRYISPADARNIIDNLPPFVSAVGLCVNSTADEVERIIQTAGIHLLQFHGDETEMFCRQFNFPYIKALRVKPEDDVTACCDQYPGALAILLDTYTPDMYGGSGQSFNWDKVPLDYSKPIILAGGLTAANVSDAIDKTACYAVDVSGGVERSKGIKDPGKLKDFCCSVFL